MTPQYITIDKFGDKHYYADREMKIRHRTDGPAVERSNGTKIWYVDGKHRTDGPAVEGANGTKSWYVDGKLHRTDGPAIEYADGSKIWFVDGKRLSRAEFGALCDPLELTLEDIASKFGVDVRQLKIKK